MKGERNVTKVKNPGNIIETLQIYCEKKSISSHLCFSSHSDPKNLDILYLTKEIKKYIK